MTFDQFKAAFGKAETASLLLAWSASLSIKQQTLEDFIEEYASKVMLSHSSK